jgi:ABC-type glycerol-3-phosphate transport system substrate-binding protein
MKRSLLWIIVLVLSISIVATFSLTSCKKEAEEKPEEAAEKVEEEVEEVPEEAAVEEELPSDTTAHLVIWCWSPNDVDLDYALKTTGFNDKYPNITWEFVLYGTGDVYVNLPLAITAGSGAPDICLIENSHIAGIIDMGGIMDVTEKTQPYLADLTPYKLADLEVDGRYYGVPWDGAPVGMFYRRDVFEEAGLASDPDSVTEMVSTWDKYYKTAKIIKDETGKFMQPQNKANNNGRLFEMLLWQQGLGYLDANGNVAINSPKAVETLEFIGKMCSEELYSDQVDWTDDWYGAFSSPDNSVASHIEASWMAGLFKAWIAPDTGGLWGAAQMPAWEEGGVRASADGGSSLVITEQCKNPDAAWALIQQAILTVEGNVAVYNTPDAGGYTPSLMSTYSSDTFDVPDPFFADQAIGRLFCNINAEIPVAYVYSK